MKNMETRSPARQVRRITKEMEQQYSREGGYTDLVRLNALKDKYFGSISAMAKATGIKARNLERRMNGVVKFTFEDILRLAYVFSMTEEEVHEIFFSRYVGEYAASKPKNTSADASSHTGGNHHEQRADVREGQYGTNSSGNGKLAGRASGAHHERTAERAGAAHSS